MKPMLKENLAASVVYYDKSDKRGYKNVINLIKTSFPTIKLDSLKRKLDFFIQKLHSLKRKFDC